MATDCDILWDSLASLKAAPCFSLKNNPFLVPDGGEVDGRPLASLDAMTRTVQLGRAHCSCVGRDIGDGRGRGIPEGGTSAESPAKSIPHARCFLRGQRLQVVLGYPPKWARLWRPFLQSFGPFRLRSSVRKRGAVTGVKTKGAKRKRAIECESKEGQGGFGSPLTSRSRLFLGTEYAFGRRHGESAGGRARALAGAARWVFCRPSANRITQAKVGHKG